MNSDHHSQIDLLRCVHEFIVAAENNDLTEERWTSFEQLLRESDDACRLYAKYMDMSALLPSILEAARESSFIDSSSKQQVPVISPAPIFHGIWGGTSRYLSSGWPVAYLISTVIIGIGALIGSFIYVSQPVQVAQESQPAVNGIMATVPAIHKVGQISGMMDCKWADPKTIPATRTVCLDQTYALESGFLEITYNTGAKVILQGPVTYKVASTNSGYLSAGKLIARIEKKKVGEGEQERTSGHRSLDSISTVPDPFSLAANNQPLFTVKTPTAVVTDLGTEFGVEVAKDRGTIVHVFVGKVLCELASQKTPNSKGKQVVAGQTVQVGPQAIFVGHRTLSPSFVRAIPKKRAAQFVSLVDLVAGGNGFGNRTKWGIDPRYATPVPIAMEREAIKSSDKYQRYAGYPQIDGVFIPHGGIEPEQIDSAGHTCVLPATERSSFGMIRAMTSTLREVPAGAGEVIHKLEKPHPVLALHANAGITFDLASIRRSAGGRDAVCFQTVVQRGVVEAGPATEVAGLWVFVDGQLRFDNPKFSTKDGALKLDIPLSPKDRFLTLVVTDGGDGIRFDHIGFHNPRVLFEKGD